MTDELVMQFLATTGTDEVEQAVNYLEMAAGDLNQAVTLFFEMGASTTRVDNGDITDSFEGTRSGKRKGAGDDRDLQDDDIPAALPAFNERLIDNEYGSRHVSNVLNLGGSTGSRVSSNTMASYSTSAAEASQEAFTQLFAPPKHMVFQAGIEEAKRVALKEGKWILVNIQRDDEFASHALNRDVWRAEVVQELLAASFVFWQRNSSSEEGKQYCSTYRVTQYPLIAIMDPRTGRQMKKWEPKKFCDALSANSELFDFLETAGQRTMERRASRATPHPMQNLESVTSPPIPPSPEVDDDVVSIGSSPRSLPQPESTATGNTLGSAEKQNVANAEEVRATQQAYAGNNSVLGDLHKARQERMQRQQQR